MRFKLDRSLLLLWLGALPLLIGACAEPGSAPASDGDSGVEMGDPTPSPGGGCLEDFLDEDGNCLYDEDLYDREEVENADELLVDAESDETAAEAEAVEAEVDGGAEEEVVELVVLTFTGAPEGAELRVDGELIDGLIAELAPDDKAVPKLLTRVDAQIARQKAKEKKMYGKMFG